MASVCIIIPFYNEENRFETNRFIEFCNENSEISFCLVNDGSCDGTLQIINHMKSLFSQVDVLDLHPNKGKAEAIRCGVNHVLCNNDFTFISFLDADFSAPPESITYLLKAAPGKSIIFGSRIMFLGTNISRSSFRHYVGRIFATMASELLSLPIYDTQCGAKIFSSEMASIAFKSPFVTTWLFDLELIMRIINEQGWDYFSKNAREVPLLKWIDKGGSKVKLSYMFRLPFDLLKIRRIYGKAKKIK